jgi:hypothetical protein
LDADGRRNLLFRHARCSKSLIYIQRWFKAFDECLAYFRNRHLQNDEFTHHFASFHSRKSDHQELVQAVLKGDSKSVGDTAAALLIIVYRLRNNLFHGVKWAYELRGQLDNFRNANALLILALDHGVQVPVHLRAFP